MRVLHKFPECSYSVITVGGKNSSVTFGIILHTLNLKIEYDPILTDTLLRIKYSLYC
jgi:hypothetical protein